MPKDKLAYLELPSTDVPALKQFYGSLFGWSFQDYGPDYAAFSEAGLDGGFNASDEGRTNAPLAIIENRPHRRGRKPGCAPRAVSLPSRSLPFRAEDGFTSRTPVATNWR